MSDEYATVMIHEAHHPDAWRWIVVRTLEDSDGSVAEGVADTEDLAEDALRCVVRLLEGA